MLTRTEIEKELATFREHKANLWREAERFRDQWEKQVDDVIAFYEYLLREELYDAP